MSDNSQDVTRLLADWRRGDERAGEALVPLVYDELRRIARRLIGSERRDHTLQPTALVHEAYQRLVGADVAWKDRAHFYAVAARAMRRLLVDHARARSAEKRGSGDAPVTLGEPVGAVAPGDVRILDLNRALDALAERSPRKARIVELHFFAGLTHQEVADTLELSVSTVRADLRFAQAWLRRTIAD